MSDPTSGRLRLSVILVQYDRRRYRGALGKLLGLLGRLEAVETTVVVVDNGEPGWWSHEVTEGVFHVGGDNSAWEFSAFDHGVRWLEQQERRTDVFAFVTDAYQAYGDEYLERIDCRAVQVAHHRGGCVGWIDAFSMPPEEMEIWGLPSTCWLRSSFLFMARAVHDRVRPLAVPLKTDEIFGATHHRPFAARAAISSGLQERLLAWLTETPTESPLEEAWHSRFHLDAETFPFFRKKVCSILREQHLSARLRSLGVPCFDFRALAGRRELSDQPDEAWQWLAWMGRTMVVEPRHHLDTVSFPTRLTHGEEAGLVVAGWVASRPRAGEVLVELGDWRFHAACDERRPDVDELMPEYSDEPKGFRLAVDLSRIPPGLYPVRWSAPGTGLVEELGNLDVAPRMEFVLECAGFPERAPPRGPVPFSVSGVLVSSAPLSRVGATWNGEEITAPSWKESPPRPDGLSETTVRLHGLVEARSDRVDNLLELSFETASGDCSFWRHHPILRRAETRWGHVALREIGPWDPLQRSSRVLLLGSLDEGAEGDRLELLSDGRPLLHRVVGRPDARSDRGTGPENGDRGPWIRFALEGEVRTLSPGMHAFELRVLRANGGVDVLASWKEEVLLARPEIHVDRLRVEPIPGPADRWQLEVSGWVLHHQVTRYVELEVDGTARCRMALIVPRPDLVPRLEEGLVQRRGFHGQVVLERDPGPSSVRLVAVQDHGEWSDWRSTVLLEPSPRRSFVLDCEGLEELSSERPPRFWSVVAFSGRVSHLRSTEVRLEIDEEIVDAVALPPGGGEFAVSRAPDATGDALVRLEVRSEGLRLYDSGARRAEVVAYHPARPVLDRFERIVESLEIAERLPSGVSLEHALSWLASRFSEGLAEFEGFLERLDSALRQEPRSPVVPVREVSESEHALRVLFAAWEVPCRRHGGGVAMLNLLRGASERGHRITLVHAFSPEETSWVDDARAYVERVVSVPRRYRDEVATALAPLAHRHLLRNYTPELRARVEQELASGRFDVVDFEYSTMVPHIPSDLSVPHLLSVLELGFEALLTTAFRGDDGRPWIFRLEELFRSLYFHAVELPGRSPNVVAVTAEDARGLARLAPGAEIYLNTPGVDEAHFAPPEGAVRRHGPPSLVFLGNYRHPPNVVAAKFLAERILPAIRERHPDAFLRIVGSHAPGGVLDLGARPGVEVVGFVEDFRPLLWESSVFVAPIFTGVGIRVKLLEAMASGLPVVTTPLGIRGIGAENGRSFRAAESVPEFVDAISELLAHPSEADELGRAGLDLVTRHHSIAASARSREWIWRRVIEAHRKAKDPDAASTESVRTWTPRFCEDSK